VKASCKSRPSCSVANSSLAIRNPKHAVGPAGRSAGERHRQWASRPIWGTMHRGSAVRRWSTSEYMHCTTATRSATARPNSTEMKLCYRACASSAPRSVLSLTAGCRASSRFDRRSTAWWRKCAAIGSDRRSEILSRPSASPVPPPHAGAPCQRKNPDLSRLELRCGLRPLACG
jgi:hypothetical protein